MPHSDGAQSGAEGGGGFALAGASVDQDQSCETRDIGKLRSTIVNLVLSGPCGTGGR